MTQSARHSSARPADLGRHRQPGESRSQPARKWPVIITVLAIIALIGVFLVPQWLTGTTAGAADDRQGASPDAAGPGQGAGAPAAAADPSPGTGTVETTTGFAAPSAATGAGPVSTSAATGTGPAAAGPGGTVTQAARCPLPGGVLRIVAAPELAGVLNTATGTTTGPSGPLSLTGSTVPCRIVVTALDPALFVAAWRADPAHRPQVWIPDSSVWLARAAAAGIPVAATAPSVASSPAVLALSATAAARLSATGSPTLDQVLATRLTSTPIRIGLPDPRASIPAVEHLLAVQRYVTSSPAARSALTWAVGSGPEHLPTQSEALLNRLRTNAFTAFPVSEQSVVAHNESRGGSPAVAVYNGGTGVGLDYPLAVIGSDPVAAGELRALQSRLLGAATQRQLTAAGFRDPAGHLALPRSGVSSSAQADGGTPAVAAVDKLLRDVAILQQPSRLLAVIDVSGSMGSAVAGTGGATRLDLAKSAATLGLALYPSDSEVGIWVFSRHLTATTDYRELVPVGPLTAVPDSTSGAQRVGDAIAGAQVEPDGATGLYDTTLAAVQSMARGWDPRRVNAVLILSDGRNDDQGGLSLPALLSKLQKERDPARPVPVITIGLGPDSDVDALGQISRATGGATYVARDPRDIGQIFLDAVGQRLCRPHC